ncbi:MAG: hypothetical protein JWM16_3587, partial [Verrucomicrobiales bacterium]|nr:hypothetical protein [Verrucomicrobiales bacterium]
MPNISSLRNTVKKFAVLLKGLCAFAVLFGMTGNSFAQDFGVRREVWTGLTGSSLLSFTNGPTLQSPANLVEILTNAFEGPYNYDDKFGDRFRALLIPPISGTYVFWVQGDDAGILSLSTDESPWNKRQIAVNTLTALYRAWYVYPSQESTNIFLQAGQRYFIEALHSAGTGDDSLAVGWKLPDGTLEQPIPASRLKPYGAPAVGVPGFSVQPTNVTVTENSPVTFLVGTTNLDAVTYQWQRNGINLSSGFGASLNFPSVTSGDSGATFRCLVSNTFGSVTSFQATLTVTLDLARPTLSGVANIDLGTVEVLFSEPVEAASGTNVANYGLSGGAIVNFAKFATGSTRAVQLSAGPLAVGSNYTLTVNNVKDRAATPNTILANTQLTFPVLLKGIYREVYTNVPGSAISDLTNSPAFPNSPNFAEMLTGPFETASYQFNHYGQRVRARILPPVTGNYTFWVAAGNSALLFLGTNNNPSSIRQIASVNELMSVSTHQWEVQTNQRSAPITLTAGQQYYIEAWTKGGISEGFPADHLGLRWQMPDGTIEEAIPALRFTPEGMASVNLVQFPTDISVMEGTSATFTVSASNLERVTYQWQQNGINIPGATNATYIDTVVKLAENNATLRCVVSNGFATTNSPAALLTVTPDVTPPGLANVFNQGSNRVVIIYSEPVEALSATNVLNYSIGGIIISNAVLQSDNRSVFLATSKISSGSNYLVTVNGVRDRATTPNIIVPNSQWVLQASDFYPQDIGGPSLPGSFVQNGNGLDITASGSGLSAAGDQMTFGYQQRRGDFDVKVRLQRLDFADTWTFAGLVAREDLTTNCQFAGVFSTPSINGTFFEYRTNGGGPQITGSFPANYPYTWLRLQRLNGQTYNGFASYDGLTWIKLGSVTETNPATMYVGLAVSSRNPARSTIAEFRDFAEAGDNDVVGNFSPQVEPLGPSSRRTGLVFTEIMYHPAPRTDAKRQEFIELYNSNPTIEDISGFRISGDVDYTFAPGTIIPGGGFLVIAKNPADIQTIYGIPSVMGPYAKSLSNKKGTVRLRNRQDAILLEVNYDSKAPWPPGPDGTGHSLVLARPSVGEDHPEAWAQSDRFGGSPGKVDGYGWEPARNVMINELLAHTDFPDVDYIELYNHSKVLVDLSGCWLTDDPATNKFRIPNGTTIAPGGFLYFTETTMGFGLSAAGEAIYLVNSNLTRVLDCLSFEAQENGVAYGRFPDGAPKFSRLAAKTPGGTNAPIRSKSLVINEIMYHPITDDDNDEFIELYNRGPGSVNLSGWRLTDGIDFTFPTNTIVASNGYLVVAKNIGRLLTNYANLNTNNTVGNYSGTLANSGERIALSMPDSITSTNLTGVITTNWIYIPVDEVLYGTGGKWGNWSDAGGSSLELIDPRSDNRLPSNWADSDDSAKSTWTSLSISGAFDNAGGSAGDWNELQFYMLDAGECLVDQVNVSITQPFLSGNIVTNSGFEAGMSFWTAIGDQRNSFIENTGFAGTKSLHVVSTGRGDVGANRIHTVLTQQYTTNGMSGTVSAQAKWLRGTPYMVFRLRGNHLEIPAVLNVPKNLGTPGARNSRFAANVGPAITEIQHTPVLPAANQPIVVSARIHDPDGVASVQVIWRVDSIGSPVNTVTMFDNGTGGDAVAGDGIYTGTIPGQANDKMLAFYVQATDGASPGLTTRFPNDAPTRECLIHIGEEQPISTFGTYRFWMTQATLNDWLQHEKFSSEDYKGTFVLGNYRVMYNAASHYAGSPAHAKLFDSPIGTNCDYQLALPADDA